jgi:type IX secretion system PorP/SprF family membrane protein
MKTLINIIATLILSSGCLSIYAQQMPMYTHYMYNTLVVNPAYAGSRDALTVTGLNRSQWVGFEGAPTTQTLTIHAPLRNEHIGLGLAVVQDKIGPVRTSSVTGTFAYIMKLTPKAKLSLGLSAGINIFQANLNTLLLDQQSDPVFLNNIDGRITPDFGFGAYYAREKFYAGVSVPNLLQNSYSQVNDVNGNTLISREQRHYFFITGTMLKLSDNLALKPTTLIKVTQGAPIQADLTAMFVIMNKFQLGAMFRSGDAAGGLFGFDITNQFHVGYAYDWSYALSSSKYNSGSHEIMLRYDFLLFDKRQIQNPRYF